jgi:Domain of unknown function (DUF4403)
MSRRNIVIAALIVVVVALAGAAAAMKWLWPSVIDRRPKLAEMTPLAPVTRSSRIVLPAMITMTAIRDLMERAPRDLSGKPEMPLAPPGAEISWSFARSAFAVSGRPEGLTVSASLSGSLRAGGQTGAPGLGGGLLPGNLFGSGFPGGLFGGGGGQPQGQNRTDAASEQGAQLSGNVVLTARPNLLPEWRVQPNLAAQVSIADATISIMGMKLTLSNELKPMVERTINEQVASLQERLGSSSLIEQSARQQWAQMCRAIPLGAAGPGAPNLWLEVRPTRAFAAQPSIDQSAVVLTFGVQAETRIVPSETKPDCPFPSQLDLVRQMERGEVSIAVPMDIPFTEISRLLEAQLKGKTFPEDKSGSFTATIEGINLAASGDRLLMSVRVRANETKSWFGFGAEAMIHVWGRPTLDRGRQVLRMENISADIESEAAFGLLGAAAKAAVPYLERTLAENSTVDLRPLADNARRSIEAAVADFQKSTPGVRVDASVTDMRLAGIEFDSKTLRVIGEAEGTARVVVTELPAQ